MVIVNVFIMIYYDCGLCKSKWVFCELHREMTGFILPWEWLFVHKHHSVLKQMIIKSIMQHTVYKFPTDPDGLVT